MIIGMKNIIILILILNFFGLEAQNKRDNQLLFGERGGVVMDFSAGEPTLTRYDTDFKLSGGNASICDKDGNLLFYTNGCKIFNNDFEVMSNGDSIAQHYLDSEYCANSGRSPLQQGAIILPLPSSDSLYMVLYNDLQDLFVYTPYFRLKPGAIYSSIIDMSLDGGKGEVIKKNSIVLEDSLALGGFQACKHINDNDWWIIYPEAHTNCMYVMLLTNDGITNIDKQCLGHKWNNNDLPAQSSFSPDGMKFCRFNYYNGLNLFDFDNSNGTLSNPVNLNFQDIGPSELGWNGIQFSPNSRFIYATSYTKIFQLDLDESDVAGSRILLDEFNHPDSIRFKTRFHNAFLAPNGKIYVGGTNQWNHLHVIHNPNCKGLSSNFEQYAIRLDTLPGFSTSGVPNFPHFRIQTDNLDCDTTITITNTVMAESDLKINAFPNPSSGILNIHIQGRISNPIVSLFNATGQHVLKSDLLVGENSLPIYDLPNGIYFYKIIDDDLPIGLGKIILQKE